MKNDTLTRKIKDTPVLTGEHAERFEQAVKENESKKVSSSDYARAKATYARIIASYNPYRSRDKA